MSAPPDHTVQAVLGNLTPQEKANSVVYLADKKAVAGSKLTFPHLAIDVPWTAAVAFIDKDPTANYSHSCRYLLLNLKTKEVKSFEAQLPPFNPRSPMRWRVIYRSPSVPSSAEWTFTSTEELSSPG